MTDATGGVRYRFAYRMSGLPRSFLDELFRVSNVPGIISFAGGLPDSSLFDLEGLRNAARDVFEHDGCSALQYTTTDGYRPLREIISARYRSRLGLAVDPDEIQIVNGSQQSLDLTAKILCNPKDTLVIERPGYLGAIEAFSFYSPEFVSVSPDDEGPNPVSLRAALQRENASFFYGIPNSQNPSGCSWSEGRRREVADILQESGSLFYEDDAFGELFFDGRPRDPVMSYAPDHVILSGSFSKIIAPGMRIGWIRAPAPVLAAFNRAKQAADLHSNLLSQMVLTRYLTTTDVTSRIHHMARVYGERCRVMIDLIEDMLPGSVSHTTPSGGMFLMLTLPDGLSSSDLFREGITEGVAVMPGIPFYVDQGGERTVRLNFSTVSEEMIQEGMERLSRAFASCG